MYGRCVARLMLYAILLFKHTDLIRPRLGSDRQRGILLKHIEEL